MKQYCSAAETLNFSIGQWARALGLLRGNKVHCSDTANTKMFLKVWWLKPVAIRKGMLVTHSNVKVSLFCLCQQTWKSESQKLPEPHLTLHSKMILLKLRVEVLWLPAFLLALKQKAYFPKGNGRMINCQLQHQPPRMFFATLHPQFPAVALCDWLDFPYSDVQGQ